MELSKERREKATKLALKDIESYSLEVDNGAISYTSSEVWIYLKPIVVKGNSKSIKYIKSIGYEFYDTVYIGESMAYRFFKRYKVAEEERGYGQ